MTHDGEHAWLALVATPIGNLEDVTLRALRLLREADLIAAEDTRRARKLCARHDIDTQLTSFHAHNEHRKVAWLLDQVEAGRRVAVLSDAGTPAVSDPGFLVVRAALERGIEPVVVPGPSALTFAVVAAGMPVDRFAFLGFAPVKRGKRRQLLSKLADEPGTYFLFESPHRIQRLLEDLVETVGGEARVALIREATKLHEECIRGTVASILEAHAGRRWRGELTVAVDTRPGAAENADCRADPPASSA